MSSKNTETPLAGGVSADAARQGADKPILRVHDANATGPAAETSAVIILDYLRERYQPDFRDGTSIHCRDGGYVRMNEACAVPDSDLIARLEKAADAPRYAGGLIKKNALPSHFRNWVKVAWGDLLKSLPDEDAADLGGGAAAGEEFRRLVRDALLSEITLGEVIGKEKDGPTQTERRSLIDWCYKFAQPGPWVSVRSKRCWCKSVVLPNGELILKVAIRHELFAQLRADRRLCEMNQNQFSRRAARYGVGTSTRDDRPNAQSVVVLDRKFVAALIEGLPCDDEIDTRAQKDRVIRRAHMKNAHAGEDQKTKNQDAPKAEGVASGIGDVGFGREPSEGLAFPDQPKPHPSGTGVNVPPASPSSPGVRSCPAPVSVNGHQGRDYEEFA